MSTPLVTVLVTNYNYERFLGQAVASALAQDYPAVEVLIADDGSTDGSLAVARSFPAARVLELPHRGVAASFLAGVREARGEYIVIQGSDDVLHRRFVSTAMAALAGRKRAFAYVGAYLFGPHVGVPRFALRMRARPFSKELLRLGPYMLCAGPVPRKAILEVGGYDASLPVLEDWDFWLRLVDAGYVGIPVDQPLYYYRHHSRQTRNRMRKQANDDIRHALWERYGGQPLRRRLLYRFRTVPLAVMLGLAFLSPSLCAKAGDWLLARTVLPGPFLQPVPRSEAMPPFDISANPKGEM